MSLAESSTSLLSEWHVLLHGQRRGPYSLAALHEVLESHPEGWSASVWRPGMLDWRPALGVAALAPAGETSLLSARADLRGSSSCSRADPRVSTRAQPEPSLEARMSTREPNLVSLLDAPSAAVTAELVTATARAPRPRAPAVAETTHDMPVYRPRRKARRWHYLAAIGGALSALPLAIALALRSATPSGSPADTRASTHEPDRDRARTSALRAPPSALAMKPSAPVLAPAPAITAPSAAAPGASRESLPSSPAPREHLASASAPEQLEQTAHMSRHVRVRSRWAPIRAEADPSARVLCSVPRGTALVTFGERPGTHARWFHVRCDAEVTGWLHENFLASLRR
jgi:hypothetical protein